MRWFRPSAGAARRTRLASTPAPSRSRCPPPPATPSPCSTPSPPPAAPPCSRPTATPSPCTVWSRRSPATAVTPTSAGAGRKAPVALLDAAYRYVEHDLATWELAGRLLPHVRAAVDRLDDVNAPKPAARLLNETSHYLLDRGILAEARRHLEQSLEIPDATEQGPQTPGRQAATLQGSLPLCGGRWPPRWAKAHPTQLRSPMQVRVDLEAELAAFLAQYWEASAAPSSHRGLGDVTVTGADGERDI
jgi:hypothetical protein